MPRSRENWTLADLIDFEQALASSSSGPSPDEKRVVAGATSGLSSSAAPRTGWHHWFESRRDAANHSGRRFLNSLGGVTFAAAILTAAAGGSAVLGLWERTRGGVNVSLFLAIILGFQWLVLLGAFLAWIFRRRSADAFSQIQEWLGKAARHFAGGRDAVWWNRLMEEPAARRALLWRLARSVQTLGVAFNLGALAALAGLILFRNVGFFWETTTEETMREILGRTVATLSAPWSTFDPASVPDWETIGNTRLAPGDSGSLPPGPHAWWRFLLWSVVVWGMLPRWILRSLCHWQEKRVLAAVSFQSKYHRGLWREWFESSARAEIENRPTDGALVIDVGGAGFSRDLLRPLLLRKLRVNPVAWERIGVLDSGSESSAREALARADAAIVLLAEGWALSPRQITGLLERVTGLKGNRRVVLLVGNATPDGSIVPPDPAQRRTWENFVDSLSGSDLELIFAEGGTP